MLQLLAERHDLGLGRVQLQSAGSHPLADVLDADSEAVNGCLYLADLAVVNVLVDVPTMMQDQLFKLISLQKVQQRPQDGTLRNTKQKQLLTG